MPNTNEPQALSPKGLADQLFDVVFAQVQGDHREAARQVIVFLKESLVYAICATAGDEAAKKGLLKSVAESIVALTLPLPPATTSPPP